MENNNKNPNNYITSPVDVTSKTLILILIIVVLSCWGTMIWATYKTYQLSPPLPQKIVDSHGQILMTQSDIIEGKAGFQKTDLMDYGSLYGMGSYYGEDFTAKYLVALAKQTQDQLAQRQFGQTFEQLSSSQQDIIQWHMRKQLQQINLTQTKVVLPMALTNALVDLQNTISKDLLQYDFKRGYTKAYSLTPTKAKLVADFLIYTSLTTVARRPNTQVSWTNNWPYQPSIGNVPTTATFIWSWVSIMFLLLGIGVVLVIFRLFIEEDKDTHFEAILSHFKMLMPSQKAIWKYIVVVGLLLLLQIFAGSLMAHDYAERSSFYGFNLNAWLPFAFLRDVHLQTPIAWIGLGWIGSALFLAPIIGRREAKGQKFLVDLLFWVTLAVVVSALVGNYLGIMGYLQKKWFWIGNQGLSYIELGRLWQILFFVGLLGWSMIMLRSLWPTLKQLFHVRSIFNLFRLEHLLWYSTLGMAFIYAFGMIPLTKINASFTLTDFWRWWVVHLWVEWAFELFAAALLGYFLMATGLVSRRLAERAIQFEWILILGSGILGTGHHLFWNGTPGLWIPIGSVFSFLEVLPLFLLILEAIEQYRKINGHKEFKYRLAYMYILGSTFWNFVGAGVFGGLINAPLINYYEHGTFLTLNHAHTAMFGAFGLLSLGLIYLCLRFMAGDKVQWSDRLGVWAFWLYNIGMILWVLLNFFPVGWPQLIAVYEHGYAYARSLAFYNTTLLWQWLRMPGDIVFSIGAILMAFDFIIKCLPFAPKYLRQFTKNDGFS